MNKNIFLDANIFIDLNDKKRDNSKECLQILDYLVVNNYNIFTSCDLITTIYYILAKTNKEKALDDIAKINKICTIIDFSNEQLSQTIFMMKEDKHFKDLEDAIQYTLALNTKCDAIISNDKNFYSPDIACYTSNQIIKKLNINKERNE